MTTDTPRSQLIEPLTRREQEVLDGLRRGLTNRQIAGDLGISPDGVKFHVSSILGKLGVRSRYEAAYWPERAPWWAGGLAPVLFWWRRTVPTAGAKLSTTTAWVTGGALFATMAALALLAFVTLRDRDSATADILLLEPAEALAVAVDNTRNADSYRMTIHEGRTDQTELVEGFRLDFEGPDSYYVFSHIEGVFQSCTSSGLEVVEYRGTPLPEPTYEETCVDLPPEPDDRQVFEMAIVGDRGLVHACFDVEEDCDAWQAGPVPEDWEPVILGLAPWHGSAWPFVLAKGLQLVSDKGAETVDGVELRRYRGLGDALGTAQDLYGQALDAAGTSYSSSCERGDCTEFTFAEASQQEDFDDMSFLSYIDVFVDPATHVIRRLEVLAFPSFPSSAPMMVIEYSDFGQVSVELPE